MKKIAIALAGLLIFATNLIAANWGDSFNVILTPAGDRGVIIDTTTINIGDLAAGTTVLWASAIPVISTGSIADIEYTIRAATSTPAHTLSSDGQADSANEIALYVLFQSTQPASTDWEAVNATTNLVTFSAKQVGDTTAHWTNFEGHQGALGVDMDNLGLNVSRNLWFRIKSPPTWTSGATQTLTITVTAEPAN